MHKHNFKNYISAFFLVFILLVVSETAYVANNNIPQVVSRYLTLSKNCLEYKNYSCEAFFLKKATDVEFKYFKNIYPSLITENIDFSINQKILEKFSPESSYFMEPKFVLLYYYLGLNIYNSGDSNTAARIWQNATYLSPELSYSYVESANLYQKLGDNQMALKILDRCVEFNYPKKHCQYFLDNNITNSIIEPPGFLKENFNEFFAPGHKN